MAEKHVNDVFGATVSATHAYVSERRPSAIYPWLLGLSRSGELFIIQFSAWRNYDEKVLDREKARGILAERQAVAYAQVGEFWTSPSTPTLKPGQRFIELDKRPSLQPDRQERVVVGAAEEGGLTRFATFHIERDGEQRITGLRLDTERGPEAGAWGGMWADLLGGRA